MGADAFALVDGDDSLADSGSTVRYEASNPHIISLASARCSAAGRRLERFAIEIYMS
jgi:hypothetical protein